LEARGIANPAGKSTWNLRRPLFVPLHCSGGEEIVGGGKYWSLFRRFMEKGSGVFPGLVRWGNGQTALLEQIHSDGGWRKRKG